MCIHKKDIQKYLYNIVTNQKMDLFDNTVLCRNCSKKMIQSFVEKDGFRLRALKCPSCSNIIIHPSDIEEYNKFKQLRGRQFHVKLRMVGNSYTVSIPREIVNFMQDAESEMEKERKKMHEKISRNMQDMMTLAFEEFGKMSLMFGGENLKTKEDNNNIMKKEAKEK